ncbi:MAG: TIGR03667 family PPOX class F420-dependent oxidoreductase [Chloroflexota bacterium]|nr:TIGR03667 family PPOX class F420-dependent oxidoreductase [Chloroflexota bacterium]
MLNLDPSSEFGGRVLRRIQDDLIAWLTTVDARQTPRSVPIWFYWDGESFLVYSQPNQLKLRNIARNPRVGVHLRATETGGDIVVFTGEARPDPAAAPANEIEAYVEKYRDRFKGLGQTPQQFAATYSVPIRITPDRVSGF